MLEAIPTRIFQATVFRLVAWRQTSEFLREQGADEERIEDLTRLLKTRGIADTLEEYCEIPFRRKPRLSKTKHVTRFSDGSFGVFYGSLEPETAEAEVRHWAPRRFPAGSAARRTLWYLRLECDFDGSTKDLRPMQAEWPKLTHDHDYELCNRLGAEAVAIILDGLLAPSVRKKDGTNVPVFTRKAIHNPRGNGWVEIACSPVS